MHPYTRRQAWIAVLGALACVLVLSDAVLDVRVFAQDAADEDLRARLENDRVRVVAQKQRWERFVAVQQELARDPGRLARAAEEAASELRASGVSLVAEGATAGLSNLLSLQGTYARIARDRKAADQFKRAAAFVSAANTLLIRDFARPDAASARKPSAETMEALGKVNAVLKLVVLTQVRDKTLRDGLDASLELTKANADFLTAYLGGDAITMKRLLPVVQSALSGTLTMTRALATRPSNFKLQGVAASIAQELPAFAPVAKMMATTALTNFNISLALANIGWGAYAVTNGFLLESQAEAIRADQLQAAAHMARLLPRARAEIARAAAAERRLTASLDALGPAPPRPPVIQPSARFVDDAPRYALAPASLPAAMTAIRQAPSLTITLSVVELDRRVDGQRAITAREREAERQRQEQARRAAREEARRRAAAERERARQADVDNDARGEDQPSRSAAPDPSRTNAGLERARRVIEEAKTWKFQ